MGGQGDITGASRPSRRLMLASVAVWLILALGLPLAALTLNLFRVGGAPLGFWITAQGAIIGLAALALGYAWRAGGAATEEGVQPGLVFAGEAVGAAALLGFTGYIAALGYDALALPLGLVAGLALLAIVVAPRFVLYPVRSIGGFFAIRYGGGSSRRLALLITSVAMVLVLAADLKAGAYALQSLTRIDLSEAIAAVALGVAAIWLLGSILPLKKIAGLGFVAVAIGLLITLVALALHTGGSMLPQLKLGTALENLANLNQTLVVNRLSDVKSLTPMTSPFLLLSMRNFAGLLLAVALGIVAAPHLLGRHVSQAVVAPGDAVRRTAYALVAVAVIAVSLPPLAIYSRIGFEQVIAKGIEDAAIPKPFTDASALGWVEVCKQNSSDAAELAAACAKMSGQRGFLRLQDLSFATDGFVVAAPVISGLDPLLQYPLLLGILLAAVLVGNALVAGLVAADAEVRTNAAPKRNGLDIRSAALGAGVFVAAAVLANVETVGSGLLAAEGFAFLAAGMFPPLVLGLHWRHMNATGAVAAMLVGAVIVAAYLIGVHVWPVEFFRISGALSDAAPSAVNRFAVLEAAYNASPDPQAQALAWAALRQHAGTIANWGGLKPAAIVLVAVPLGLVAGLLASLLSKEPRAPAPAAR